jgi:hypothetical protein
VDQIKHGSQPILCPDGKVKRLRRTVVYTTLTAPGAGLHPAKVGVAAMTRVTARRGWFVRYSRVDAAIDARR